MKTHVSTCTVHISPVLKSSTVEFDNYQNIFVRHFASQSIVTSGVLAKYRSFLWNWTPSHIQRIYKGQNSFLMLFSGIPHLPTFCHVACVTYVTSRVSRASRMSRVKCQVSNVAQKCSDNCQIPQSMT